MEKRIPNEGPVGPVSALGGCAIDYAADDQVPNDGTADFVGWGIYLNTTGTLVIQHYDGTTLTYENLAAGVVHPLTVKKIIKTGSSVGLTGNIVR